MFKNSIALSVLSIILASCASPQISPPDLQSKREVASVSSNDCELLKGAAILAEALYLEKEEFGNIEHCRGTTDGHQLYRTYYYGTIKLSKIIESNLIPELKSTEYKDALLELTRNSDLVLEATSRNGDVLNSSASKSTQCKALRANLINFKNNLNFIAKQCH